MTTSINIGYARVSTQDQNLALQHDALAKVPCDRVFTDTASGAKSDRAGLADALSHLRKGDTLVVWKLDRLGRSLKQLIEVGVASENGKNRTLRFYWGKPFSLLSPLF
jgi:DNA invertase Pin-like site-specific DNA recombinase